MATKKVKTKPKPKPKPKAKAKAKKKARAKVKSSSNMKIIPTSGISFADFPKRGSKYDPIFAKVAKLRAGQSVVLPVPKGIPSVKFHNRLNSAMAKADIKAPKGCSFHKRTTKDGKVAISCTKD